MKKEDERGGSRSRSRSPGWGKSAGEKAGDEGGGSPGWGGTAAGGGGGGWGGGKASEDKGGNSPGWGGSKSPPAAADASCGGGWGGGGGAAKTGDEDAGWGRSKSPAASGGWGGKDGGNKEDEHAGWGGNKSPAASGGWGGKDGGNKSPAASGGWGGAAGGNKEDEGAGWGGSAKSPGDGDDGGWGKASSGNKDDDGGWGSIPTNSATGGSSWGGGGGGGGDGKRRADDGPRSPPPWKRPRNNTDGDGGRGERGDREEAPLPDYIELCCPDDLERRVIKVPPGSAGAIIGRGGAALKALRASIPGYVQISLDKGADTVAVTSDSLAAVEKVESFVEAVVARLRVRSFRPDVSFTCFLGAAGSGQVVKLRMVPREARGRCLPEFVSPTKELFFYQQAVAAVDEAPPPLVVVTSEAAVAADEELPLPPAAEEAMPGLEAGGDSPTSPLPPPPVAEPDKKPIPAAPRAGSSRVDCLPDWPAATADDTPPPAAMASVVTELAQVVQSACATYRRGTRVKVQAQLGKTLLRGVEAAPVVSGTVGEVAGMLERGDLTLQSAWAHERAAVDAARAALQEWGYRTLPVQRKVSVHFVNPETKVKHAVSMCLPAQGPDGGRAAAARAERERLAGCTDYFQVLGVDPTPAPAAAADSSGPLAEEEAAYRRLTMLLADEGGGGEADKAAAAAAAARKVVEEAFKCLADPERRERHRGEIPRSEPLLVVSSKPTPTSTDDDGEQQQLHKPAPAIKVKRAYGRHAFFSFLRPSAGGDFRVMVKTRPSCPESVEPVPDADAAEMTAAVTAALAAATAGAAVEQQPPPQQQPAAADDYDDDALQRRRLRFSNAAAAGADAGEERRNVVVTMVRHKAVDVWFNHQYKVVLKRVLMDRIPGIGPGGPGGGNGEAVELSRWEVEVISLRLKDAMLRPAPNAEAVEGWVRGLLALAARLTHRMGGLPAIEQVLEAAASSATAAAGGDEEMKEAEEEELKEAEEELKVAEEEAEAMQVAVEQPKAVQVKVEVEA